MSGRTLPTVYEELWIARKLGKPDLFDGVTNIDQRRGLLRAHLVSHGLGDVNVGRRDDKPESWKSLFERLYREPLGEAP